MHHSMNTLDSGLDAMDGEARIKTEGGNDLMGEDELLLHDIKKEPVDGEDALLKSLYTSKGLQPDCHDLDQLFDEGGSPSLGVSVLNGMCL